MNAEIGTIVLVNFARSSNAIKGVYVGMEPGAYIIIRFPSGAGVHDYLYEGSEAVIKYISFGKVFGFRTEVMGYMYKKGLILCVLAFPKEIETHKLRREQRVDFLVPAQLTVAGNVLDGFVVDISPGGCRFSLDESPDNLPFDFSVITEVTLSFHFVGLEGIQTFVCQVKNVVQDKKPIYLGLEFNQADSSITQGIREYIQQVSQFLETD